MSTSDASVVLFPEPVGPGDEHEAARQVGELLDRRGRPELVEVDDLVRDRPHHRADGVPLQEHVHAEPALARQRVRAVELEVVLEPLALLLREDRVDHLPDLASR